MSLARKHYVAVAKVIESQMVASYPNVAGMEATQNIAIELASMFAADNPRFSASTFFAAASVRCYLCRNYGHVASEPCLP